MVIKSVCTVALPLCWHTRTSHSLKLPNSIVLSWKLGEARQLRQSGMGKRPNKAQG